MFSVEKTIGYHIFFIMIFNKVITVIHSKVIFSMKETFFMVVNCWGRRIFVIYPPTIKSI